MSMALLIFFIFLLVINNLVFIYFFNWIIKHKQKNFNVINFESYILMLNYTMEKAYEIIHKNHILVFSVEGLRPNDKDVDKIAKEFVKLVINLLGPNNYNELTEFFGSKDAFILNLIEYFNTKFDNDEIRESAINSHLDSSDEVEKWTP